jgi:hypothetical protein
MTHSGQEAGELRWGCLGRAKGRFDVLAEADRHLAGAG